VADRPYPAETILKLVGVIVACAVLAAGLVLPYIGGLGLLAGRQADKFLNTRCNLIETPPPQKTILYANDKTTPLATLFTYDRELVKLSQVPKYLQQALIATEDRRFYSHQGVDMRGLIRSAVNSSSGDTQGGSTLTMQYVKQVRYYQADTDAERAAAISQTLSRKMEDAQCALDIEKKDTKNQILEKYLNIAFFGENSYGIGVAAKNFFGHAVGKLTLPEAALLVGVVKAPTEFDPFVPANHKAAIERRNQVIQNLADVGDITQAAADKYKATALALATTSQHAVRQGCAGANPAIKNAGFFCDYVVDWLERGGISSKTISTGGLKIVTTINKDLQNTVQQSLWDQVPAKSKTTAMMPIVEPNSGNVLAMATSKKYGLANDGTHTTVPIFTNASAGAGSTYKYFSLLAALKVGVPANWPLSGELSSDQKFTYTTQHCGDPGFQAKNDSEGAGFTRTETLASATAKSSNTYFVALEDQLFGDCELAPIVNTALDLGMGALNQRDTSATKGSIAQNVVKYTQPTFTLGFAPTSPLQLTGAYATVANDGEYCQPAPVVSIKDANGKDMEFKRQPCARQVTEQVARNALKLLSGDTTGQGTSAHEFQNLYSTNPGLTIAGKTGTVNASDNHGKQLSTNADLWFVGLTPDMAATTALFNIDTSTKPIVGIPNMTNDQAGHLTGAFAAGVWANALTPVLQSKQWQWPDANAIPNAVPIPTVVGKPYDEAKDQLTQAGFKVTKFGFFCGSDKIYGAVAFQSSLNVAESGSNITLCVSNGQSPYRYVPPKPVTKKTKTPGATPPGTGTSRGRGTGPPHH
jgi:membrane peptidoglycan carboxypeptidase